MITSTKIKEWINEIENRPMIAPFIIRRLSDRLMELDIENETLRSENLAFKDGSKIKEYEKKVGELQYQMDLLKRQIVSQELPEESKFYTLIYRSSGELLAAEWSEDPIQVIESDSLSQQDDIRILPILPYDELMVLYDSGRVTTIIGNDIIQATEKVKVFQHAYKTDLKSGETIADIVPITRTAFAHHFAQISRGGFVKGISKNYFQTFLSNKNMGTGTRQRADKPFSMTLCEQDSAFTAITSQGMYIAIHAKALPASAKELIHLNINDYIVSAFSLKNEPYVILINTEGAGYRIPAAKIKVLKSTGRKGNRIQPGSDKTKLLGGSSAGEDDQVIILDQNGILKAFPVKDITEKVTPLVDRSSDKVIACTFQKQHTV